MTRTVYPGLLTTFVLVPAMFITALTLAFVVLGFLRSHGYWITAGYFACCTAFAWHVTLWLYKRDLKAAGYGR